MFSKAISSKKIVIVDYNVITPYGLGVDCCWNSLLNGKTAVKQINRIDTKHFITNNAAVISGLDVTGEDSLVMQMLKKLFFNKMPQISYDTSLFLSTTAGEIDLLEKDVLGGRKSSERSNLKNLLSKIEKLIGIKENSGVIISAACASSTVAIARAGMMISTGEIDCVLIVACDCVSEFVFSGFSALMALDKNISKPFDKYRNGLSLGEAAGYILLVSEERSKKDSLKNLGELVGWGFSSDAYHMTGPSPDGSGLATAIENAFAKSGISSDDICSISAHGTGTRYNDAMEIRAFNSVFKNNEVPAYSIKGGTGHTLATAGLLEAIIALKCMDENTILPTVNFSEPDDDCMGEWISSKKRLVSCNKYTLKVNAGFGGINAALILKNVPNTQDINR